MPDVTACALARISVLIALICAIAPARAQSGDDGNYPIRPIHIVVPFPPGGPTDILSRIIGEEMTASWGQPVVIENRPGADTTIGAQAVAKADPDGYTLLAAMDSTMVLNPLVKKDLPYDPFGDFEPISLGAKNISILEVRADSTAQTVADLIGTLKANPGKLNFGASTTNGRLAAFLFAKLTGTSFAIIPYKGSAETVQGLLTGSVDFGIDGIASSFPLIKDGKFRALAKLADRPLRQLPDLPPLADAAGVPELGDISTWIAFYAPAGTSSEIVGKLSHFIATIYADPAVAHRLDEAGIVAVSSTPSELKAFARSETERWGKVIRDNGNFIWE
ncbi:MAG TPA: tripartite tricarboxylate transporter substrate binding protein [Xanthobacteraceae bacterium]|nr:tripartite tricarboxylate transporter substrate binding protein [Xanthobacteraceae bacterium]